MPIRADLRKFYGATWRKVTRPRILARAGNKCEICGAPNKKRTLRAQGWWILYPGDLWRELPDVVHALWNPPVPNPHPVKSVGFPKSICRDVWIVIGVGHLNNVPGDDRDENLLAMCQYCHLNHDAPHHRETRATRKDRARPLIAIAEGAEG